MPANLRRLELSAIVDLPVLEASGVTVRRSAGGPVVLVVGDRTAELGVCHVGDDGELAEWSTIDLAALPQWPYPHEASQFESISSDGGSLVALTTFSTRMSRGMGRQGRHTSCRCRCGS